jgi:alpha 1,2-mannosyltransferase
LAQQVLVNNHQSLGFYSDDCGPSNERPWLCAGFHGHTMVQYDLEGNILFLHKNLLKWNLTKIPSEFSNSQRQWERIQEFRHKTGSRYKVVMEDEFGVRLEGDIRESDFQQTIGFDLEKISFDILNDVKARMKK